MTIPRQDPDAVAEGFRRARAVTRGHARSFYFASAALAPAKRRAAFALYAFCRRLDDLVDEPDGADVAAIRARLDGARAVVRALAAGVDGAARAVPPWHPTELAALGDTLARHRIPAEPLLELVRGVEMDLTPRPFATRVELDAYCYRVAGTVGEMMAAVLGARDPVALAPAADLGRAMQLTNILRDVAEDLARGRLYLPLDDLAAAGVGVADLARGRVDGAFRRLMAAEIDRARRLYRRALAGVRHIADARSRLAVRLMAAIYADILRVIEAQGYDVFARRATVPARRKLALAAAVVVRGEAAA